MNKVIAVGRVRNGGPTVMRTAEAPRVIDTVAIGDNMRVTIMADETGYYVAIGERISCRNLAQACRVFNSIVAAEADEQDIVIGDSGEEIELDQIPF